MTESNTQAVAQPEAQATPAAEVASAQVNEPSLDQLLSEFDAGTAKTEPTPQPKPQATAADNSELAREVAALKFKIEIEPTLKRVRGDLSTETLSDEELLD